MSAETEHDATRARMNAAWCGLLEPEEENRFLRHVRECERCGNDWREFTGDAPSPRPDGHVPADVLARWPHATRELRGLERALVRRHVERCETCQAELRSLGFAPVLERVAELELEPAGAPAARRGVSAWTLALGAWAAAASVIAVIGFVGRGVRHEPARPEPQVATAPAPAVRLELVPSPGILRGPRRDQTGDEVVQVAATASAFALLVPPLDVPDSSWVDVEIAAPAGGTLVSERRRQAEFFPRRMLLVQSDAGFAGGTYRVRLSATSATGSSAPESAEYRFELRPPAR